MATSNILWDAPPMRSMKWHDVKRWLPSSARLACIIAILACGNEEQPPASDQTTTAPNLLLISIDSLRADHLGSYGYRRETSPNLDRLAREGVLFERMVADSSWTLPTHLTMLTGLSSIAHGVVVDSQRLPAGVLTLAGLLRDRGYRTEGFASGPYLHPIFGFGQGFDHYELLAQTPFEEKGITPEKLADSPHLRTSLEIYERGARTTRTSEDLAKRVEEAVARSTGRPFFIFVHMFDVHYDYDPPERYWRRFDPDYAGDLSPEGFIDNPRIRKGMSERDLEHIIARYDGEILYTDEHIGRMLEVLDLYGVADRTIVAVTGDHGEEFFEHGDKGHRKTLYDEQLMVPFILWGPGRLPAGHRVAMQTRMVDIAPTLLDLQGSTPSHDISGESLLPYVLGKRSERNLPALSILTIDHLIVRALREPGGKLLITQPIKSLATGSKGRVEYFDLATDPHELSPIMEGDVDDSTLSLLHEIFVQEESLRAGISAGGNNDVSLPDSLRDALESLGYVESND